MTVYITFVLDETGSMSGVRKDTIGGFNTYLQDLNKDLTDVKFSLLKFNSQHKTWRHKDVKLTSVKKLSEETYVPAGMTPLWDAFGLAITRMESVANKPDDKVIISVLTDGFENASNEFSAENVKSLIEKHPDWAINFLGADMDAWGDVGNSLGMSMGQTFSYTGENSEEAYLASSRGTIAFASGQTTVNNFFADNDAVSGKLVTDTDLDVTDITE